MDLAKSGGDDELAAQERRRRQAARSGSDDGNDGNAADTIDYRDAADPAGHRDAADPVDVGDSAAGSPWWSGCDLRGSDPPGGGCDLPGCDMPGCDVPDCDCSGCDLFRLSTVVMAVAVAVPGSAGGLLTTLIRGYRRWLSRFTPACPSRPSCSAYALDAVQVLGARRGLQAAARRIRSCGTVTARRASGRR